MEYVLPAIVAVVVGPLSAWITVQLSLRRFRAEKWWEMRVEAYRTVIEALHVAKAWSAVQIDADIEDRKVPEHVKAKLMRESEKADQKIREAIDTAGFLISMEASDRLTKYQIESGDNFHHVSWQAYLDHEWGLANSCLQDVIKIARRDLKIDGKRRTSAPD